MVHWLQALLRSEERKCYSCDRSFSEKTSLSGLCSSCVREVPWIRQIACSRCGRPHHCDDCQRTRGLQPLTLNRSAVSYNRTMKKWLSQLKYSGDERWILPMGEMVNLIYGQLMVNTLPADIITSVPLSPARLQQRSFNQAERIALYVSKNRNIPYMPLLKRVRETERQSQKTRWDRIHSLQGVFKLKEDYKQRDWMWEWWQEPNRPLRILIIDDVYTTGTTLNECAFAISSHIPSRVCSLTWAR